MSSDELVSQFMAFTGSSDVDVAKNYLEMSGNNVETAVGLFMEHNAGGGGGSGAGLGAGGVPSGMGDALGDVRAPDETRTMRLMDDGSGGVGAGGGLASMLAHDPQYRVMYEMMEEQLSRSAFAPSSAAVDARRAVNAAAAAAGSDDDEEYAYDEDDDDENMKVDDDNEGPSAAGLADMFAPPSHLIQKAGGFQGARQVAKDSKRWLLVNIQKDSEFSSHALNRDVWRNDLVENLIREGFIFWQEVSYCIGFFVCSYYHVIVCLHVCYTDGHFS